MTTLQVTIEFTFVFCPHLFDIIKIFVAQRLVYDLRVLVEQFAIALELVIDPVALISQLAGLVEEFTFALHAVEPPFSFVHASILVVKHTKSMAHVFPFVAFVLASLLVSLYYVLSAFWGTLLRNAGWNDVC